MPTTDEERLKRVLARRRQSQSSIDDFDSDFVLFSRKTLRDVVQAVENTADMGSDGIKIIYDDPYRFTNNSYLAYVVLTKEQPKRPTDSATRANVVTYFPSSTQIVGRTNPNGPSIKFEGSPHTGEVNVYFNVYGMDATNNQKKGTYLVKDLNYDKTFKLIVDFFEELYA